MPVPQDRLIVLFDQDCAFCRWTARQIARIDRDGRLLLMPLQDAAREPLDDLARIARTHPLGESLHVVSADGSIHAGGDALIEIFRLLPGGRLVGPWSRLPGARALAGLVYRAAARNRAALGRLMQAAGANCEVPPAAERPGGSAGPPERYFRHGRCRRGGGALDHDRRPARLGSPANGESAAHRPGGTAAGAGAAARVRRHGASRP